MSRTRFRPFVLTAASAALAFAGCQTTPEPSAPAAATPRVFTADGAWCWFSDPRAVIIDGRLIAGWITTDGSVQIGSRSLADTSAGPAATDIATLAPQFERDDHNHPALLVLPGGELAAFYALHAAGDMHASRTRNGQWAPPRQLQLSDPSKGRYGTTYANPFLLSAEDNRIHLFWRGDDFKPTHATSDDLGETWSAPQTLISERGRDSGNRPYVKYASDGRDQILLAFTDGHPRNEPRNGIHFARYRDGRFERADGSLIAPSDALPLQPADCDHVYDGATAGRAWIWSVAEDAAGHPVIAYTRHPTEDDHRYHYARWNGRAWEDRFITAAGRWFPHTPPGTTEREPHYSAGLALDPADPATVYLSRPVNGIFEIERWHTADGGATWTHQPVTQNSPADNVRPYVIPHPSSDASVVMWMHLGGGYRHYTDYNASLHFAVLERPRG